MNATLNVQIIGKDAEQAYAELLSQCQYDKLKCIVYRVTGRVHVADYIGLKRNRKGEWK